jgi:dienelactone hydrolase
MLESFEQRKFASDAMGGEPAEFDIYEKGKGPIIILLQELPGIEAETVRFADKLVTAGFRVVMPHLFGPLGKFAIVRNVARLFCVRREINIFARNQTSPIVEWLKALCRDAQRRYGVSGVGVIGMCLTGNFAISLMADDSVLASVASQPSLPMFSQSSLHMSDRDISEISQRLDQHGPMLAYRFEGDKLCKAAKFDAINTAFNQDKERIKLTNVPGNKHAMLTAHFINEEGSPTQKALDEIIAYFSTRLSA